jgi:hypothetical protein
MRRATMMRQVVRGSDEKRSEANGTRKTEV